jgi:hypothetical protein
MMAHPSFIVMPTEVGIHVFSCPAAQDVDGGTKPRHDVGGPAAAHRFPIILKML